MDARSTEDLPQARVTRTASPSFAAHALGARPRNFVLGAAEGVGNAPPLAILRQLMILRSIAVGGQMAAIATASALNVALPLRAMLTVVGALIALNLLTWVRLRSARSFSQAEIAVHLGADLAALSTLLFLSGGAANPFSILLVVHVVLLALLLPPHAAVGGTALVMGCFLVLTRVHVPLSMDGGEPLSRDLLALGGGVSLALTLAVIAWLMIRIVATMREHDRLLNEAAQAALRDEAVLRVGALAAGAAHELAGPLTAMAVVAGEILRETETTSLRQEASVLISQLAICRETIDNLLTAAGHARAMGGGRDLLDRFLERIAEKCRTMRPEAVIVTDWQGVLPSLEIFADQALAQALLAFLNNAVDASPKTVQFSAVLGGDALRLSVTDRGPGVSSHELAKLGRTFFTTKAPGKGAGLGLVMASRTVERLGGSVRFENRPGGGLRVDVALPLQPLQIKAETA